MDKNFDSIDFGIYGNADNVLPFSSWNDGVPGITFNDTLGGITFDDRVNSPSHYTYGNSEAIDVIEEAISEAPSVKAGMLQAQVLKYLLRLWHKDNPVEDAKKAEWYLKRLIDSL